MLFVLFDFADDIGIHVACDAAVVDTNRLPRNVVSLCPYPLRGLR
jgi:hypothetical protein